MKQGRQEPGGSGGNVARKLIFWDFARASWQYDIVVAGILLFVFATPREWFGDQPRAANIVLISSQRGADQLLLEPSLLNNVPAASRATRAAELIRQKTGKRVNVVRVEPVMDEAEKELKGFIVYTVPRH